MGFLRFWGEEKWKWSPSVSHSVVSDSLQPHGGQAPLSMGFPREEYWSGLPLPSPGGLSDPGIRCWSSSLQADSLPLSHQGRPGGGRGGKNCLMSLHPTLHSTLEWLSDSTQNMGCRDRVAGTLDRDTSGEDLNCPIHFGIPGASYQFTFDQTSLRV